MSAKQSLHIRISDATRAKLDELATIHGTQTEVVAVGIDRLYTAETGLRACPACGRRTLIEVTNPDPKWICPECEHGMD